MSRRDGGGLRGEVEVKYPTGTVAEIGLPVEHWAEVKEGNGQDRPLHPARGTWIRRWGRTRKASDPTVSRGKGEGLAVVGVKAR